MKILLSWLKEFVSLPSDVRRLAEDMTMLGLPVDSVTTEGKETVLELDITTNRPDCLSHYGVARELAAFYGRKLKQSAEAGEPAPAGNSGPDSIVEIAAADLCRRYSARIIRGVRIATSPPWLARRLERVGVRPINNVADATNFVLMAYGHPLHAFDLDRLEGGRIIVRRAVPGEILKTLDGQDRMLSSEDLVIADARRPVALAGVMGGQDSEITPSTQNVLLESAWFDAIAVRRTSKKQGLHTEASHRFERGADMAATLSAANRCIELIRQLAGGTLDPNVVDVFPGRKPQHTILLRRSELQRHLGINIAPREVKKILSRLGFSPQPEGKSTWLCAVPSFRVDVSCEIDLVEEIARHYSYDRFPLRLPAATGGVPRKAPHATQEQRLRAFLAGLGYNEALSFVLVSRVTESFAQSPPVPLANPLSEEGAFLRSSMVPGLLAALQWNLNRGQQTVRLFEIGNVYRREEDGFQQPPMLALAATGERIEAFVGQPAKPFDLLDLKGDLEQVAEQFQIGPCLFDAKELPDYYRPGYRARMVVEGKTVACMGQLHVEVAERWKIRRPVFMAEVDLDALYAVGLRLPQVQPLSRFPAVERDFSVMLPETVWFEAVRDAVVSLGIPELVAVAPVEIFRGGPVPHGSYSLLLRVTLQSHQTTLTEEQLAAYSARIVDSLQRQLGAQIRMGGEGQQTQ
ncbi:MAG: phenylalanine--tRNA ligase subunit beta [Acidobacteria bacterium]|nr:phenylalanine--tRNA ligase subunit beta [Acidobacteriota bacterium]